MHLHGPFSDTDIEGNLFGHAALCDLNHDIAFSRGQRFKTLPECSQRLFTCPPGTITGNVTVTLDHLGSARSMVAWQRYLTRATASLRLSSNMRCGSIFASRSASLMSRTCSPSAGWTSPTRR